MSAATCNGPRAAKALSISAAVEAFKIRRQQAQDFRPGACRHRHSRDLVQMRNATETPLAQGLALERNLFLKLCITEPALARMRSYEEENITSPSRRNIAQITAQSERDYFVGRKVDVIAASGGDLAAFAAKNATSIGRPAFTPGAFSTGPNPPTYPCWCRHWIHQYADRAALR
jgi:hypothetical protein